MSTVTEQIVALETQIANLRALVQGSRYPGLFYAWIGNHNVFGCKITQGFSGTDMILALEGEASGDTAHLNPDLSATPVRPEEYSNIANVYGEVFLSADKNVSIIEDDALTVTTAPGTGYHRYDIVYSYVGAGGPAVAIAAGTAVLNASTPADPTLPAGVLQLARIHVEASVTGIANAKITDLRNFSGRLFESLGISTVGAGVATFLATPSSVNLKAALTDETGSGAAVFATSPTLVTPALGVPASGTLTNCTGLPIGGITQNTARLLGRTTASAGASEEITVGSGLSLVAGALTATGVTAGNVAGAPAADQSITSSTTLTDATSMGFAIAAGESWVVTYTIDAGAAMQTTGMKTAITVPAGATLSAVMTFSETVNGGIRRTNTSGAAMDLTAANCGADNGVIRVSARVVNSSTAGTVQLQIAQSTSSGTAVTLRVGSHFVATRL